MLHHCSPGLFGIEQEQPGWVLACPYSCVVAEHHISFCCIIVGSICTSPFVLSAGSFYRTPFAGVFGSNTVPVHIIIYRSCTLYNICEVFSFAGAQPF